MLILILNSKFKPCGYKAPLVGRNYIHGIQDCYSIVRDFYERELGINLSDYEREDAWWESRESKSLYLDNFEKEGFVEVNDVQYGDVMMCRVGRTEHHAIMRLSGLAIRPH